MPKSGFFLKIIISCLLFVVNPSMVRAAIVYLDPSQGDIGLNEVFMVKARIDNQRECLNAVEANLGFSTDFLELIDFSIGESILNLWIAKPERKDLSDINKSGKINFIGGIPGGYCGKIAGDPGESDVLASLIFRSTQNQPANNPVAKINFLPGTKVLLNDGQGSEDKLSVKGSEFSFNQSTENKQEWQEQVSQDKISPEPFVVELIQDKNLHKGKYFIIFNTTDKQTGIDHYKVLEIPLAEEGKLVWWEKLLKLLAQPIPEIWVDATMPYVLYDQYLQSRIQVKAVDKAGNQRITEYIPTEAQRSEATTNLLKQNYIKLGALVFLLIIAILSVFWLRKNFYSNNR